MLAGLWNFGSLRCWLCTWFL